MEKKDKEDIILTKTDKFIERVQNYGKLIIIVGTAFVGIVIFYLNVKSTSDLTSANSVEIMDMKKDFIKRLQELAVSVNNKIEDEFVKRDEMTAKYRQIAKENIDELKRDSEKNLDMTIDNSKDICYIKGHLKMRER